MSARQHDIWTSIAGVVMVMSQVLSAADETTDKGLRTLTVSTVQAQSLVMSPDGKVVFIGWSGGALESFDFTTGKKLHAFVGHSKHEYVTCLAVSPDGNMLASGASDGIIKLWSSVTGKALRTLEDHDGALTVVAFAAEGKKLLSSGYDITVRLWDVQTGQLERVYEDVGPAWDFALSGDGKSIIAAGGPGGATVLERDTGKVLRRVETEFGGGDRAAISPARSRVLLCRGAAVDLVAVKTGKILRTYTQGNEAPDREITSINVSADWRVFVCGSRDGTVRMWDVGSGAVLQTVRVGGDVNAAVFAGDVCLSVVIGVDDKVLVWSPAKAEATSKAGEHHQSKNTDATSKPAE